MADKSPSSRNACNTSIKIEEEWFDDDGNRPIEDKKIKLKTIQRGFQMNDVEFAALREEFAQHIVNTTDSHNIFLTDSSQEDLQEALRKINIRPQKDAVTQRRALIPSGWRNTACFALLCQAMIEWRDAELTNRDNSRSTMLLHPSRKGDTEHATKDNITKSLLRPYLDPTQQRQNARDMSNGQKRKLALDAPAEADKAGAKGVNQKKYRHSSQASVQEIRPTIIDLCEDEEDNGSEEIAADTPETDRKRIEKAILAEEDRPMNVSEKLQQTGSLAQWNIDTWKDLCEFVRRDPNDFFSLFALPGYNSDFYLRPYQIYAAFWALTRLIQQDLATYGAILADMMGMGKTAEFWAVVYLAYADVKGGMSREEALGLPDGPEKKQRLNSNGEYPVGIKWTLTARRLFNQLSRGPVVLIVPADLIAQTQAEFNKYFVRGDPYWNFELFIQHKNWSTHGLNNQVLQRLRQKGPKVLNNGIILLIHPAGWTSMSFKKLFYVLDDNGKPIEPIQPPSIIGFDEYPAAGGRSERGPVVESIRQIYENMPAAPYPLFIGMTGAPIYRTVRDLRAFVSIICSHKRFDKEEIQQLTLIQRRQIIEGDEADWQNNDRMMHVTRDRITEVAKNHERILELCGEQDYKSISLLNKWRCAEVGKNNKLTCQGVMIRRMPNDFWPNPEAEKKERLLDLPPLNQKTIFVRQHPRYLDGLRKFAKPLDADATRDYKQRLQEWEESGRPEGEKPKKGLPESRYSLNRCAGSWPVLPLLVTDPASGFRKKPFEASFIREKGWNSKTLTQLHQEGCPVAVHIDEFIDSCEKLEHLITLFNENKQVNMRNMENGERLQKILIATAGYEHVPILRMAVMKLCPDVKLLVVTSDMGDKRRGDSIRAFNGEVESDTDETSPESEATVMLADIRDMGKGHNIQAVTDIVMWNPPWTVPETDQIIGRAWRGGQTRSVRVWHYVNTGHPLELALYNRNDKQAVVLDISLNISRGDPEAVREDLRSRGRYDDVVELDS